MKGRAGRNPSRTGQMAAARATGSTDSQMNDMTDRSVMPEHDGNASDLAIEAVPQQAFPTTTSRQRADPSAGQLVRMAAACPPDIMGARDRALLLLAASGVGRIALVRLDAEQIRFTDDGVELRIDAGADAAIQIVKVPRAAGLRLCPARMLEEWMRVSGTRPGPVFCKIDRLGNLEQRRLGTDAIRRIFAYRGKLAKIPQG